MERCDTHFSQTTHYLKGAYMQQVKQLTVRDAKHDMGPIRSRCGLVALLALVLVTGCGDDKDEVAKKLGFENATEMMKIQSDGWYTKERYNQDQLLLAVDAGGWNDVAELETGRKGGFTSRADYLEAMQFRVTSADLLARARTKFKEGGFESVEDYFDAQRLNVTSAKGLAAARAAMVAGGFSDIKAYVDARAKLEAEKARADAEKAEAGKLMDAEYLYKTYKANAMVQCREPVERLAKHNFEWFDGWLEAKFDSYINRVRQPGVLKIAGDKIKFQNGFGGWQIMEYSCEYDTQAQKVINVSASPR